MATETSTEIPRPESGDVVELILEDQERNRILQEGFGSSTHVRAHLDLC